MLNNLNLHKYSEILNKTNSIKQNGTVSQIIGLIVESLGPSASIGDICYIHTNDGTTHQAEVVGFKDNKTLLMPLKELYGIAPGNRVSTFREPFSVSVGDELMGRVLDGLGNPMDDGAYLKLKEKRSVYATPPNPLTRTRITEPLQLGIRAIDGLLTCGKGQRTGIFAGSGVGKSVLLGMMARYTKADVNVIALIGERGREVRDFIENDLGAEGLKRSVVVVATSDQAALTRVKGAMVATTIAEYFRDQGLNVLLMMDSVTRYCMALREIGLAVGEPPTTKGYTPSVFAALPKLLERAGTSSKGTITGLYTVLVEGDDMDEPIADAARSILDGHIVLSRKIAAKGHYPAIDILSSISRVMNSVASSEHKDNAKKAFEILATYKESEDMINIGAYSKGANKNIDYAIDKIDSINTFLKQRIEESSAFEDTVIYLEQLIT
ncbi:MAG: flagellar protein export ATPase FliI [Candidatus Cloacimonadales bacterium]|jgi:flagellum-specific ATP synthase|nr:flagellar protein export ATPase FliI [Candidatus Cloacimonadota bacterium]MDD2651159.1 flagellar protein export ATPase FliI [Candidatus Cloacimonadota bacterium]MDD3501810.1 flagellar protein export ATPase FliI [Candidatus Cloacimonadota bacterium]MDX9976578.1 flagellar protein export ATPase FliI [Candidatus Cloacimonadales bacterium]